MEILIEINSNLQIQDIEYFQNLIDKSLTKSLFNKPTDRFTESYKKIKDEDTHKTCHICMNTFNINQYKRTLHCTHEFHKKCIDKLINKYEDFNCPLCRQNVFHNSSRNLVSKPSPVE